MISSIQNRQQNTSFGAYQVPHEIVKQLKETNAKFTTIEDYACDLCNNRDLPFSTKLDLLNLAKIGKNTILEDKDIKKLEAPPKAKQKVGKLIKIFIDSKDATVNFVDNLRVSLHSIDVSRAAIAKTEADLSKTLGKPEKNK